MCVGPVRLLKTGEEVADHVWLTLTLSLQRLKLNPGDVLAFDATVTAYWKGYFFPKRGIEERRIDYKLVVPSAFAVLRKGGRTKQLTDNGI